MVRSWSNKAKLFFGPELEKEGEPGECYFPSHSGRTFKVTDVKGVQKVLIKLIYLNELSIFYKQ